MYKSTTRTSHSYALLTASVLHVRVDPVTYTRFYRLSSKNGTKSGDAFIFRQKNDNHAELEVKPLNSPFNSAQLMQCNSSQDNINEIDRVNSKTPLYLTEKF